MTPAESVEAVSTMWQVLICMTVGWGLAMGLVFLADLYDDWRCRRRVEEFIARARDRPAPPEQASSSPAEQDRNGVQG